MSLMAEHVFEQLVLPRGQFQLSLSAHCTPRHHVDFEIPGLQSQDIGRTAAAQEGTYSRQELGQRERFDHVVVGAKIQPAHTIVDAVPRGQNQHWRLDVTVAERLQNLESAAAGQHQIEYDQVEDRGVRLEEPLFTRGCHDDLVVLRLQRRRERLRELPLILDHQESHIRMVSSCRRPDRT